MKQIDIVEVSINGEGRLCVRPKGATFEFIYRAGMDVDWDEKGRVLFGGIPSEWSYERWFRQIVAAAAGEYATELRLLPQTKWTNVPEDVQSAILAASGEI